MTLQEVRKKVENPRAKNELRAIRAHESRIRLHALPAMEYRAIGAAWHAYLSWVRELIPADKFALFQSLMRFPLPTVTLCEEAFKALEKVFDGRDANTFFEFSTPELSEDWETYRAENLGSPWIWREMGFETMKTAINSVVVVDIPAEPGPGLPEPYAYHLSIDDVLDYEMDGDGMDYVIFAQPENQIAVLDKEAWRLYRSDDGYKQVFEVIAERPHGLGYCPARFFWTTPVTRAMPYLKASPLTNVLGDLDWYLFFANSKRHLDLYAPYPIYSGFAADCDYEFAEGLTREYCERGFLRDGDGRAIFRAGKIAECPQCSTRRIAGVGSFVEVPAPSPENNNADLRNPVQITTVDRASLDYNVEEVDRLRGDFLQAVTGFAGEQVTKEAINEKQVKAFFESRTNILRSLKKDFETIQQWTEETVCRLRYGAAFVSCTVDYGSEFYLLGADDLMEMYLAAREGGADSLTLDTLQEQYYETRFRNNPAALARALMLIEIEPLRHVSPAQLEALRANGAITQVEYLAKVNFSSLLLRFERENADVTRFAIGQDKARRVQAIQEAIFSYINTEQ